VLVEIQVVVCLVDVTQDARPRVGVVPGEGEHRRRAAEPGAGIRREHG
jgi:hypothetical protein